MFLALICGCITGYSKEVAPTTTLELTSQKIGTSKLTTTSTLQIETITSANDCQKILASADLTKSSYYMNLLYHYDYDAHKTLLDIYRCYSFNGTKVDSSAECQTPKNPYEEALCVGGYAALKNQSNICESYNFTGMYFYIPMCYCLPDRKYTDGNSMLEYCYRGYGTVEDDVSKCDFPEPIRNQKNIPVFDGYNINISTLSERNFTITNWNFSLISEYNLSAEELRKDSCIYGVAIGKDDESICGDAGFFKDSCYFNFAAKKASVTLCDKIDDGNVRSRCIGALGPVNGDVQNCFKINKTDYIGGPVVYSNMPGTVPDTDPTTQMQDKCIFGIVDSQESTDKGICDKIRTMYYRNLCYQRIAINSRDPRLCTKEFVGDESNVNGCFNVLSIELNNISLCYKTSNPSICVSGYAIYFNKTDLCASTDNEDWCLMSIGSKNHDLSICQRIKTDFRKGQCVTAIAVDNNDISLCDGLNQKEKDDCVQQLAMKTRNPKLCEHSSPEAQKNCKMLAS